MKKLLSIILCAIFLLPLSACGPEASEVEKVITQLKEKGLPIGEYIVFDDGNDPNGSGEHEYKEKGSFFDTRVQDYDGYRDGDRSATIEVFDTYDEAVKRAEYINDVQDEYGMDNYRYQIIKDNILLRLHTILTYEQAEDYSKALETDFYVTPTKKEYNLLHAGYMTDNAEINKYLALDFSESPEDIKKIFGKPEREDNHGNSYSMHYTVDFPGDWWYSFSIMFDKNGKMYVRNVNFGELVIRGCPPKQFVSTDQFKKISEGMTYEEVVSIFGMEGLKTGNFNASIEEYHWPLKGSQAPDIEISFTDGVVSYIKA